MATQAGLLLKEGSSAVEHWGCGGVGVVAVADRIVRRGGPTRTSTPAGKVPAGMTVAPSKGVEVTEVTEDSPAWRAGLQNGDVITAYGELPIEDMLHYVKAMLNEERGAYGPRSVSLSVWRRGHSFLLEVPRGRIGYHGRDWNKVNSQIYFALMYHNTDEAHRLFDLATQQQGQQTEFQVLMIRTMLIPEKASAAEDKLRQEYLARLVALYPWANIEELVQQFKSTHCNTAAAAIYDHMLPSNRDNVNYLLDSAEAFAMADRNSDARRNVAKAMKLGISPYGYQVACGVLGRVSLGEQDYAAARTNFKKCFESWPDEYYMMMCLYSTAKIGNLDLFDQAPDDCKAKAASDYYNEWACDIDPLTAYLLMRAGRRSEALALAAKWKDDQVAQANTTRYWRYTPGASDVLSNWQSLTEAAKDMSPPPAKSVPA
jgi:hypothetical protein